MSGIDVERNVLNSVRAVTARPGWTAEPVVLFTYAGTGLRLTAGPGGRGVPRSSFLVVADSLPDAFRAVGECLELIARDGA